MKRKKIDDLVETLLYIFVILLVIQVLCILLYSKKIVKLENIILEQSKLISKTTGKTVFLGDSITYFYDIEKYYKNDNYINQGIGGNTTSDVLNRLKKSVYDYEPDRVILLIGTNDLQHQVEIDEIIDRISLIVTNIRNHNSNIKVYVESVTPVNPTINNGDSVQRRTNQDIMALNEKLKMLCETLDTSYIDTYDKLIDSKGNLKREYTTDGLHFSARGYLKLTTLIKKVIEEK